VGLSAFVTKVNAATLEIICNEEQRATTFKTPQTKKRRLLDLDSTERKGISSYVCSLLNGPEEFDDMTGKEQLEKFIQMVINLYSGVDQLGSF
jgi:hypothetical protein